MRISHETIYLSLFVQSRGELRRQLTACLRTGRTKRRAQGRQPDRGRIATWSTSPSVPRAGRDRPQLNGRPRQTLAWMNPAEKMTELLATAPSREG